jgi:RNA polymerase sigma-70 factor (family 1)
MSDRFHDWTKRLRASDPAACTELFDVMHAPLIRYATSLLGESDTAYDVVQDAFVKLWESRRDLDPNRSLRALLYTIVRHQAMNHQRSQRRRRQRDRDARLSNHPPSPDETVSTGELETQLRTWIGTLPERQREAFRLSRFGHLTHTEIASVMDVAPRTVTNHITTALQTLRDRLHEYRSLPSS